MTTSELKSQVDAYKAEYQDALSNYKSSLSEYQNAITSQLPDMASLVTGFSGALSALPLDPTKYATANIQDVLKQQMESSRSIREGIREQQAKMAETVAQMDISAAQEYAKQVTDNVPTEFATGFTRPTLTPVTADSVTALASPNFEIGGMGGLFASTLTAGLMGEGMLDGMSSLDGLGGLEGFSLSGDALSSFSVMDVQGFMDGGSELPWGAIAGVALTAGSMAGVVPEPAGSIGTSLAVSGLTGMVGSQVSGLDLTGSPVAGAVASSLVGSQLGAGSAYSILGSTAMSSMFTDAAGGTFEGVASQVMGNVAASADPDSGGFFSTITDSISSFAKNISGDKLKSIGGINFEDLTSLVDGTLVDAAKNAVLEGDVSGFDNIVENFSKNKGIFSTDLIDLAENVINNPADISNYTGILSDMDFDLGSILTLGGSKASDAASSLADSVLVDNGILTKEQLTSVNSKINNALDSKTFSRMTSVGKRLLRDNIGYDQFKQLDAVSDLTSMAMPQSKKTSGYNSTSTNNNKLVRSAERLLNDGRTFSMGSNYKYSRWRVDSDITSALSDARYILR